MFKKLFNIKSEPSEFRFPSVKDEKLGHELFSPAMGGKFDEVKALLEKGADPNVKDEYGWTPLMRAIWQGHSKCAKILLTAGTDVHSEDPHKQTALCQAVRGGRKSLVLDLLKAGADPLRLGFLRQSSLDIAKQSKRDDIISLLESYIDYHKNNPLARIVLPTAKEILATDSEELGQQLFSAIWQDEHKKIKSLISKGADIEVRDEHGWTPLNRAAWRGKIDAVNILIEAGANLDAADPFKNTPLINAAGDRKHDCIITLLSAGADYTVKNHIGKPFMDVLKEQGMQDTIAQANEIIEKRPKKISQKDIDLILKIVGRKP